MKKTIGLMMISILVLAACSKKNGAAATVSQQESETQEVSLPEIPAEPEKTDEEPTEAVVEEMKKEPPAPVQKQEPAEEKVEKKEKPKEGVQPPSPIDDEYARSVGNVAVTKDRFVEDKAEILGIIEKLATIMKKKNYGAWMNLLDEESISYWKQKQNLKKAQARLPIKGIQLRTMEDYFKYIFIPARQNRTITEIRYISDKYVKAIEMKESVDYVYYYFNKVDGKWMLHLPPLTD
ncbi:MAG: hypothetical protein IJ717_06260 [Treponema sp.]|nr:hypothetical protein [Treponema sp.]